MAGPDDQSPVLACVQLDIPSADPRENLFNAIAELEKDSGADLYLFPELFTTDFRLEEAQRLAEYGEKTLEELGAVARRRRASISGSILYPFSGSVANTGFFIDRDGELKGLYRKTHLFGLMGEKRFLAEGNEVGLFRTSLGLVGMGICYDLRFPEMIRRLALAGAGIFLLPAQWPESRARHFEVLLAARAIENGFFVVSANRAGSFKENRFSGGSRIIDPWGNLLAVTDGGAGIVKAKAPLSLVDEARLKIPSLADRREGIDYSLK